MMSENRASIRQDLLPDKICSTHRDRLAIVYIRQSTPQQIERHQESTRLQYALVERAVHFGWPRERVVVIDDDLGRTGKTIEGRLGFQRLVAEVSLGNVGLVLGIEMSRLARSCRDWHQLLEICALFDTLIADPEAVYDPGGCYNDRLLLGLKATMSEAELHILEARMLEARMAKARRGELGRPVPMGYVRRPSGEIALDPDEQAQATIRLVFDLYDRFGTIGKVLRHLTNHDIRMPVRAPGGENKGDLDWRRPNRPSLYGLLVNPIYAGLYVYGLRPTDRRRQKPGHPKTGRKAPNLDNAAVVLPDRLPAYISWDRYQANQARLRANAARKKGPVRAGSALLSGLLVCGRCGLRMTSVYNNNGHTARYQCATLRSVYDAPLCQSLTAAPLDALMARLVLEAVQPAALEVSLAVAADIEAERAALERHWQQRLERARYEVERARRQYNAVEPENRLVARTLERAWEEALTEQSRLEAEHERHRHEQPAVPSSEELGAIRAMAQDLPALWSAETTTQEERQTIVRLLVERIVVEVIDTSEQVRIECHWQGGVRTEHRVTRPVKNAKALSTYDALVARASELRCAGHDSVAIADILNREGWRPAKRCDAFSGSMVRHLLYTANPEVAARRLRIPKVEREPDEWTIPELSVRLGVPESTLYGWVRKGRLRSRQFAPCTSPRRLVHADAAILAALEAGHGTPP
ncbi:MAG: Mobile element protein [Thermomicrobiales bacterium]|nr:Mobile element protein [Thermomicrobiales bacterium]